eukprot:361760-Chlamydomonas_euryale.AAC.2
MKPPRATPGVRALSLCCPAAHAVRVATAAAAARVVHVVCVGMAAATAAVALVNVAMVEPVATALLTWRPPSPLQCGVRRRVARRETDVEGGGQWSGANDGRPRPLS